MATNPMQRKARNSFILGVIVTLIICILVGGLLYFLLIMPNQTGKDKEDTLTYAYRLKNNIPSGKEVTAADVESIVVTSKVVPEGAFPSKVKSSDGKTWTDRAFPGGYTAKVDLRAGTIVTNTMLNEGEVEITNDLRYVEYNMLTLGTTVDVGSFVDIRFTLPNGQDLIVLSKKEIKAIFGNTVGFELTEDEILMMESAIVETYIIESANLYVTLYVEPGLQEAASKTYTPTEAVKQLINGNPNIKSEARNALTARFNDNLRTWTDNERSTYTMEEKQKLEENVKKQIENAQKAREAYLSGLTSY